MTHSLENQPSVVGVDVLGRQALAVEFKRRLVAPKEGLRPQSFLVTIMVVWYSITC